MNEIPTKKFSYIVDGQMFETEMPVISVALLRAKLPGMKRAYSLFIEGIGNSPDRWLSDESKISLEDETTQPRFYTSPPATFG
jgi:hypothetical protein